MFVQMLFFGLASVKLSENDCMGPLLDFPGTVSRSRKGKWSRRRMSSGSFNYPISALQGPEQPHLVDPPLSREVD